MGSVNNTAAQNKDKTRRYGALYSSIDFEYNDNLTAKEFESKEAPVVGKLWIGGKSFNVTYTELGQIASTLREAQGVVNKMHKLRMLR
jgi:hypothetical protein